VPWVVCDAPPVRVPFADATFHRFGTRRAPLADGQLRAILADVFEPRRPFLDLVVERSTHVQPGPLRRGQYTRRSTGG
jgi:hypothetical protein